MDVDIDNDNALANAFYKHLNTNILDFNCLPLTLSLCKSYKEMLFKFLHKLSTLSTLDWNQIVFSLYHFGMLKKIFSFFIKNPSSTCDSCLEMIPLSKVLQDIIIITRSCEVSLRHAAQDIVVSLIVTLHMYSHSSFEENYKLLTKFIAGNADQNICCSIDLLTLFLIKFKELEISNKLITFLLSFCKNYLITIDFNSDLKVFYSTLYLLKEIVDEAIQSEELLSVTYSIVIMCLQKVGLIIIDCAYRLLFLQVVHKCVKYLSDTITKQSFDLAYACLAMIAPVLTELKVKASVVGFGGQNSANKKLIKAEKMTLINITMNAFCICLKDGNEKIIQKLLFTESFLFVECGISERVNQIFALYLEQDDAMIEFFLLHLTLIIRLENKKIMFLASPHLLFVKLLQNLSFDSSVLLDWLTSNETQFLLYFLKYLKYAARTYKDLSAICVTMRDIGVEKSVFDVLKKLKKSIERLRSKNLFPYNVAPLLKVMASVVVLSET